MNHRLIVDNTVCSGCLSCMTVCSLSHENRIAIDQARIQVELKPFQGIHALAWCRHCDDAECESNCPTGAIRRHETGHWLIVDDEVCIRCRTCESVCPYGAIRLVEQIDRIIKCDLCAGDPRCARTCFTGAIWFGSEDESGESAPDKLVSRYFNESAKKAR